MKTTAKRFLSMLLALSMVFGMLVFPATATGTEEPVASVETAKEAAPAVKTADEAPPASQEEAEDVIVTVEDSPFNLKLWAENLELSTENIQAPADVEVNEDDPIILIVGSELEDITVLNADGEAVKLTNAQIETVKAYFQVYLDILKDHRNIYGVQTPFFLEFNKDSNEDGLGILGEMLVLAGYTVEQVRNGEYDYMQLLLMIKTFVYTYQLGADYYEAAILKGQKDALAAVEASGAKTEVQKLLVLNSWLAQNNTFDMPYIMNADSDESGTIEDDEKLMEAPNGPQTPEHYNDVMAYIQEDLNKFYTDYFHDEIQAGFEADLRKSVFEAFIKSVYAEGVLTQMTANKDIRNQAALSYAEKLIWQEAYDAYLDNNCEHDTVSFNFTYQETDGKVTASATMTCQNCDLQYRDDNCEIDEKITPATCKEEGKAVYTATAHFMNEEGKEITSKTDNKPFEKVLPVDKVNGHKNKGDGTCEICGEDVPCDHTELTPKFDWKDSEDGRTVEVDATATCSECHKTFKSTEKTINRTTVKAVTCEEDGTDECTVTAKFQVNGKEVSFTSDVHTVTVKAEGHKYNDEGVCTVCQDCKHTVIEATFTWSGNDADAKASAATATCAQCKKEFPAKEGSISTKETSREEATCGKDGKVVLTATAVFEVNEEDVTKTAEKPVVLPATGEHDYDETGKCKNCDAVKPEEGSEEDPEKVSGEKVVTVYSSEQTETLNAISDEMKAAAEAAADEAVAKAKEDGTLQERADELPADIVDAEAEKLVRGGVKDSDEDKNTKTTFEEEADKQAEDFVNDEDNRKAISDDPAGFLKGMLLQGGMPEENADALVAQAEAQAAAVIQQAAEQGIEVAKDENGNSIVMTTEQIVQQTMETEKIVDLDDDGTPDYTANEAIPILAQYTAPELATATINGWKGCHIGAFGMGTSVCLGYTMAYTYLVQSMHPEVYGKTEDADMSITENWKTREEVYGDDLETSDYLVDTVRVTFDTEVSMFGPDNTSTFGEVHFWNAVKVDGKWYYCDPCYVDVYVEVMARDRVETDGNMNHLYFMFSHTSAKNMYDGFTNTSFGDDQSGITSLYSQKATNQEYEDAWVSRINCNPVFKDGYAYYIYDSTDLLTILEESESNPSEVDSNALYKLVRHKLTDTDTGDGDSDYETLIIFNVENDDGELEARVYDPKAEENVKSELLTELMNRHSTYSSVFPSVEITSVLYGGKIYFNLANCILSFDLETYEVALVKEYNTVYGVRDNNVDFGGRAFSITTESKADFTVENHPIAALNLVGDELTVSIATNFALISGKKVRTNPAIEVNGEPNGYGYEYEESNFNPNYNTFFDRSQGEQYGYKEEVNDNDEFMWSANFVEKLDMGHLTGTKHTYESVTVEPFCGIDGYTENRCTSCGAIEAETREYDEGTAHEHHFIEFNEVYYTKDDAGSWNRGTCYVCAMCGYAVSEPSEPGSYADEEDQAEYQRKLAEYEAAAESAGHTYVPTDAEWSEDSTSVTFSKLECSNVCPIRKPYLDALVEDDSISVELKESVNAKAEVEGYEGDCAEGAIAIYVASGEAEGYAYTATNKVQLEPGKHVFDKNGNCKVCGLRTIPRIYGKTRYQTAFAIADELKAELGVEAFDTILVASGTNFPDALAGSYLATQKNAPILLTQEKVDSDVLAYIQENLSESGIVYILGGTAAVSQTFADSLKDAGIAYERLSGKSRYETGLKILEKAGLNGNEILVCTGTNFADALSVSAVNKPILLVNGTEKKLTAGQKEYLDALEGDYTFYIIGGSAAVSSELETALKAYGDVERISGKDRHATSVKVAEKFFENVERVALAYSMNYPDGLCGGPLAYKLGAPLLLVNAGKEAAAAEYVKANGIEKGVVFGGTAGVSDDSVGIVFGLAENDEMW